MSRKSRTLRRVFLLALAVYLVCSIAAVQVMNAALFGRADEPDGLTVRYEDVAADYPRQTVTFSSGSAQLTGWLYPAEDAAALVVIAHGAWRGRGDIPAGDDALCGQRLQRSDLRRDRHRSLRRQRHARSCAVRP